jgi:hypothetical protein
MGQFSEDLVKRSPVSGKSHKRIRRNREYC